jgi:hypothetical protein
MYDKSKKKVLIHHNNPTIVSIYVPSALSELALM